SRCTAAASRRAMSRTAGSKWRCACRRCNGARANPQVPRPKQPRASNRAPCESKPESGPGPSLGREVNPCGTAALAQIAWSDLLGASCASALTGPPGYARRSKSLRAILCANQSVLLDPGDRFLQLPDEARVLATTLCVVRDAKEEGRVNGHPEVRRRREPGG